MLGLTDLLMLRLTDELKLRLRLAEPDGDKDRLGEIDRLADGDKLAEPDTTKPIGSPSLLLQNESR